MWNAEIGRNVSKWPKCVKVVVFRVPRKVVKSGILSGSLYPKEAWRTRAGPLRHAVTAGPGDRSGRRWWGGYPVYGGGGPVPSLCTHPWYGSGLSCHCISHCISHCGTGPDPPDSHFPLWHWSGPSWQPKTLKSRFLAWNPGFWLKCRVLRV